MSIVSTRRGSTKVYGGDEDGGGGGVEEDAGSTVG